MNIENIKRALPFILTMFGKDSINEAVMGLKQYVFDFAETEIKQEGETGFVGLLFESESRILFAPAAISEKEGKTEITRIIGEPKEPEILFMNFLKKQTNGTF